MIMPTHLNGVYVSPASFKSRQRLGFSVVSEMLTTNAEDEAISEASQLAGVQSFDFTREFRQASIRSEFFFDLDGHFNRAGHRYFAEALVPVIRKMITARGLK